MTENIFKDGGEFCMRGDPQQRPVEWCQFKSVGFECQSVCYVDPITNLMRTTYADGNQSLGKLNNTDLIPIPKPPELVPWDCPEDVPEPCWIRSKDSQKLVGLFAGMSQVSVEPHFIIGLQSISVEGLRRFYEWHTDRKAKGGWKPCGKVKQ